MKTDKWVKRWKVPKSKGDGEWTVAQDKDGNYGCNCPIWRFSRKECHHIKQIKANGANALQEKPKYILANVAKPKLIKETNELYIPLVAIPDAHMMEATICFYLLKYGYSMSEIRQIRRIPKEWTAEAIQNHVQAHGEAEYPPSWFQRR